MLLPAPVGERRAITAMGQLATAALTSLSDRSSWNEATFATDPGATAQRRFRSLKYQSLTEQLTGSGRSALGAFRFVVISFAGIRTGAPAGLPLRRDLGVADIE